MEPIIFTIVALLLGLAVGWFFGSRPVADWSARFSARDSEARELDEKYRRAITELAGASERARLVDDLSGQIAKVREERDRFGTELATLRANASHFDEQKKLLIEAREELVKEFQNTGNAVLGKAQEAFLARAAERFGHAEKSSEEKIKALLAPVGERLKSYEDQVTTLEKQRVEIGRAHV